MGDLRARADVGVLQLHKVAHLHVGPHMTVGPDVGKGADLHAVVHPALVELGCVHRHPVPDDAVPDHGIGADLAVSADDGLPPQNSAGQQHGTVPHGDLRAHVSVGGVHHGHAASGRQRPVQGGYAVVVGKALGAVPVHAPAQRLDAQELPVGLAKGLPLLPQNGVEVRPRVQRVFERGGVHPEHAAALPPGQRRPVVRQIRGGGGVQIDRLGHHGHPSRQAGQEFRQPLPCVGGAGGHIARPLREAGLGRLPVIVVADH